MAIENRMRELLNDVDREQHEKRERESARCAGSELAPASWLGALAKELRAQGSRHLDIGISQNDQGHLAAGLVLDSLGKCAERTLESAPNESNSPTPGQQPEATNTTL